MLYLGYLYAIFSFIWKINASNDGQLIIILQSIPFVA